MKGSSPFLVALALAFGQHAAECPAPSDLAMVSSSNMLCCTGWDDIHIHMFKGQHFKVRSAADLRDPFCEADLAHSEDRLSSSHQ